jgi:hypothetical protein
LNINQRPTTLDLILTNGFHEVSRASRGVFNYKIADWALFCRELDS